MGFCPKRWHQKVHLKLTDLYNFDLTSNSSLIVFFLNCFLYCLPDPEVSVTQWAAVTMVGFIYTFSAFLYKFKNTENFALVRKKNHVKTKMFTYPQYIYSPSDKCKKLSHHFLLHFPIGMGSYDHHARYQGVFPGRL